MCIVFCKRIRRVTATHSIKLAYLVWMTNMQTWYGCSTHESEEHLKTIQAKNDCEKNCPEDYDSRLQFARLIKEILTK